jgi:hypothetical protein
MEDKIVVKVGREGEGGENYGIGNKIKNKFEQ